MIKENVSRIASQSFASTSPFSAYIAEMLPQGIKGLPGSLLNKIPLLNKLGNKDYDISYGNSGYQDQNVYDSPDLYQNQPLDYGMYQNQQGYYPPNFYSADQMDYGNVSSDTSNEADLLKGIRFEIKKSNQLLRNTLNSIDYGFQGLEQKTQNVLASNSHLFDNIEKNNRRVVDKLSRVIKSTYNQNRAQLDPLYEIASNTQKMLYIEKAKVGLKKSEDPISKYEQIKKFFRAVTKEAPRTALALTGSAIRGTWTHLIQPHLEQDFTEFRYISRKLKDDLAESRLRKYNEAVQSGDIEKANKLKKKITNPGLLSGILSFLGGKEFRFDPDKKLQDKITIKRKPAVFDEEVKMAITRGIPGILTKIAESLGSKNAHWSYELDKHVTKEEAIKADTFEINKKLLDLQATRKKSFFGKIKNIIIPEKNVYGKTRLLEKLASEAKSQKAISEGYRATESESVFKNLIEQISNAYKYQGVTSNADIVSILKNKPVEKPNLTKPSDKISEQSKKSLENISIQSDVRDINENVFKILSLMSKDEKKSVYKPKIEKVSNRKLGFGPVSVVDKAKDIIEKNKEESLIKKNKHDNKVMASTLNHILKVNKNTYNEIREQNKWVRLHWMLDKMIGAISAPFGILKDILLGLSGSIVALGGMLGGKMIKGTLGLAKKLNNPSLNKSESIIKSSKNPNPNITAQQTKKAELNSNLAKQNLTKPNTEPNIAKQNVLKTPAEVKQPSAMSKVGKNVLKTGSKIFSAIPGVGWLVGGGLALGSAISSAFDDTSILERGGDPTSLYERAKQFGGDLFSSATLGLVDTNSSVQGFEKLGNFLTFNGWKTNKELNEQAVNTKLVDKIKGNISKQENVKQNIEYTNEQLVELIEAVKESNKILMNINKSAKETTNAIKDSSPQINKYSTSNVENNNPYIINNSSMYNPNTTNNFQSALNKNVTDEWLKISSEAINASKN